MSLPPKGWIETVLGQVISPYETIDPTARPNDEFTYIDIGSIDNKTQSVGETKTFLGRDAPSRARRVVKEGDVLFSTVRTYLKNIAQVTAELDGALTSTGIAVLRANASVDNRYLFNWVCSDEFIGAMSKEQDGTLYPAVTDRDVLSGAIRLPPLSEQQRIVETIDGLRARTARANVELARVPILVERYRQRLLALAFSGELTASWREARELSGPVEVELSEVAKGFSYGSSAKSSPAGRMPVLRMGNIQSGKLDWSNLVFTSDEAEIAKYSLAAGDVLFNRTNSPELVGKTALYRGEQPSIYAGYLIRIQSTDRLLPEFLAYCLNGPAARSYCWQVKTDGVSQSNINAKKIAAFRFLLPGREEQAEIVRRIDSAFGWLDRVASEYTSAAKLLPKLDGAILAKAFRGELIPQEPDDEPASALLERARREQSEPIGRTRRKTTINSKDSLMAAPRLQPSERILQDSENWPASGLPVTEVMSRNPLPHDDLRDALFDLLSGPTPRLQQEFDPITETMMIKRVAA